MIPDDVSEPACPDPDFPSGEWTGFYQQAGSRYRMEMCMTFRDGIVSGAGGDGLGRFTVRGRYDAESREVTFVKHYLGAHDVYYRGFREVRGIWGLWEIGSAMGSGFHIWPRADGELDADSTAAEIEAESEVGIGF